MIDAYLYVTDFDRIGLIWVAALFCVLAAGSSTLRRCSFGASSCRATSAGCDFDSDRCFEIIPSPMTSGKTNPTPSATNERMIPTRDPPSH